MRKNILCITQNSVDIESAMIYYVTIEMENDRHMRWRTHRNNIKLIIFCFGKLCDSFGAPCQTDCRLECITCVSPQITVKPNISRERWRRDMVIFGSTRRLVIRKTRVELLKHNNQCPNRHCAVTAYRKWNETGDESNVPLVYGIE